MFKVIHFRYMHVLAVGVFVQKAHAPSAVGIWWRKRLAEALCLILGIGWHLFGGMEEDITLEQDLDAVERTDRVEKGHNVAKRWGVHVQKLREEEHKYEDWQNIKLWHYFLLSHSLCGKFHIGHMMWNNAPMQSTRCCLAPIITSGVT